MSENIVKVHDGKNNGCLFFIFIVLVVIAYQLIAIGGFLKETFRAENPIQQVEVEK